MNQVTTLTEDFARRLRNMLRDWETNASEATQPGRARGVVYPKYMVTTSSVSASTSTSTLGSGTATFRTQYAGALTSLSNPSLPSVTVYNSMRKTIASGSLIQCVFIDGHWSVLNVDQCSSLS